MHARAASSMFRFDSNATMASSCLRVSFFLASAICCQKLPSLRGIPPASPFDRLSVRRIALQSAPTRVIHVVTVITAKGEITMTELTVEAAAPQAPASSEQPKAAKKARVAPKGAHVAKKAAKSPKKASPAKKAPKSAKKAKTALEGSKTNKVLELLKRPGGVTSKELMPYASHCTSLG